MTDGDITWLLNKCLDGDLEAEDELFRLIHAELRRRARRQMAGENPGHTMGPTDLVHQAYIKLKTFEPERWNSRAHFYATFSNAMRQVLIDHARAKRTEKRGGAIQKVPLDDAGDIPDNYRTLLDLDPLLRKLSQDNPDANVVFHLKHFGGLSFDQIAEITGLSLKKIDGSWKYAKSWLQRGLSSQREKL